MSTQPSSSSLIVGKVGLPLIERIRHRRALIDEPRNFQGLGKMIKLNFDPQGMHRPDPATIDHFVLSINSLEWQKEPGMRDRWGNPKTFPSLVMSNDEQDLMMLKPIPPLPALPGPDFDDPATWVPTDLPGWQTMRGGDPRTVGRMPRRYPQHYGDLTDDFIGRSRKDGGPDFRDPDTFYVLQPVHQILIHPFDTKQLAIIAPRLAFDGTKMSFVVNPLTGEAHFIGGRVYVNMRIHTLPAGAKPYQEHL